MDDNVVTVLVGFVITMALQVPAFVYGRYADRKIRLRGLPFLAASSASMGVTLWLVGVWPMAYVFWAGAAWILWLWWNSGGGDGFKRALKKAVGYLGFGPQVLPQGV